MSERGPRPGSAACMCSRSSRWVPARPGRTASSGRLRRNSFRPNSTDGALPVAAAAITELVLLDQMLELCARAVTSGAVVVVSDLPRVQPRDKIPVEKALI